jgi:hypothetical protein
VHWASTDPAQIREWWSQDPAASIGVATGQVSALAVIDIDVKASAEYDGATSFTAAFGGMPHLLLAAWPQAYTPSGGGHIWMRTRPGAAVPERPGILRGVDVKGDGGYVLAAPSARLKLPLGLDGERVEPVPVPYQWWSGCPCSVPLAPDWLYGWLASAPVRDYDSHAAGEPVPDVADLMKTGVPVGERNHRLYKLACSLYRKCGTDMDAAIVVYEQIRRVWEAGDTADFGERELRVCVESARKFIARCEQQERMAYASWVSRGQA